MIIDNNHYDGDAGKAWRTKVEEVFKPSNPMKICDHSRGHDEIDELFHFIPSCRIVKEPFNDG